MATRASQIFNCAQVHSPNDNWCSTILLNVRESKLPELRREAPITNEEIRDRDWARKLTQKDYMDTKRHAVESQVEVGDQVLLRNTKINKLSPNYDPSPCEVIDRNRGEVTLRKKDGVEVKRNVSFVKEYQENGTTESESVVPLQPITSQPIASQPIASQPIASQPVANLLPQFRCSRQLTQVHLRLKQARDQLELLDFLTI